MRLQNFRFPCFSVKAIRSLGEKTNRNQLRDPEFRTLVIVQAGNHLSSKQASGNRGTKVAIQQRESGQDMDGTSSRHERRPKISSEGLYVFRF